MPLERKVCKCQARKDDKIIDCIRGTALKESKSNLYIFLLPLEKFHFSANQT